MRDFRLYMAVGGMPQAVQAYVDGKDFSQIDAVKRGIISLYIDDFKKIDDSGLVGRMYRAVPSQLATNKKKYVISAATQKRRIDKDNERLSDLLDSKTVIPCHNTLDPGATLSQTRDDGTYKLYLADTGLFTTMLFDASPNAGDNIYSKLLGDKLSANLGYLYENVAAQVIASTGRDLYYHTWMKEGSTHSYEVDFVLQSGAKIVVFEVKSSARKTHESMDVFCAKYSRQVSDSFIISQTDAVPQDKPKPRPLYMLPFILEEM